MGVWSAKSLLGEGSTGMGFHVALELYGFVGVGKGDIGHQAPGLEFRRVSIRRNCELPNGREGRLLGRHIAHRDKKCSPGSKHTSREPPGSPSSPASQATPGSLRLRYAALSFPSKALLARRSLRVAEAKPGGAERDRTADLVNAIHALSQLSYSPNSG